MLLKQKMKASINDQVKKHSSLIFHPAQSLEMVCEYSIKWPESSFQFLARICVTGDGCLLIGLLIKMRGGKEISGKIRA